MTHNVENRLRAALEARAALVDTLPAGPTLQPATSPWRRAAPVLLAVAAVALLVLGLVLLPRGGPAPQPLPPADRAPEPVPGVTGDLSGDLTGDGRDDVATLVGNQLRVELATGEVLTARVGRAERLLGIVDLEQEPGVAVAFRRGEVDVWVVRDELTELHEDGGMVFLPSLDLDGRRAWIDPDGALMDAAYVVGDPVPVAMAVRRWVAEGHRLRPVPQPMHCGDPDADVPPTPCRATPVGSDADLPDLRTTAGGMRMDDDVLTPPGEPLTFAGRTLTVVGAPEGDGAWDSNVRGELVMRGSGVERRIQLPAGGVTGIVPVPSSDIVAVLQVGEHREDWTFVRVTAADLVVLTEPDETPIDGQWVGLFDRTTWITEDGLFTRESIAEFGIHQLWRWEVPDGALVPVELGRLCLDDNFEPTAYGAC